MNKYELIQKIYQLGHGRIVCPKELQLLLDQLRAAS